MSDMKDFVTFWMFGFWSLSIDGCGGCNVSIVVVVVVVVVVIRRIHISSEYLYIL